MTHLFNYIFKKSRLSFGLDISTCDTKWVLLEERREKRQQHIQILATDTQAPPIKYKFKRCYKTLGIANEHIMIKTLNLPPTFDHTSRDEEIQWYIKLSASKLFSMDAAKLSFDFQRISPQTIMIFATRQSLVQQKLERCANVHSLPDCIEPETHAMLRALAFYGLTQQAMTFIHFKQDSLQFSIISDNRIIFTRYESGQFIIDLQKYTQRLRQNIHLYEKKLPDRTFLSGHLSDDIINVSENIMPNPIKIFHPLRGSSFSHSNDGIFTLAFGLALRGIQC